MPELLFRFAESLRTLLHQRTSEQFEQAWETGAVDAAGWAALALVRRKEAVNRERILDEIDGLLLRLLDRLPVMAAGPESEAVRIRTFRIPSLERLQHAAAATLVGHRYGVAGLRTVVTDAEAPVGRRYFAFLGLAELHPEADWPLFARYLTPAAHHAFQGAAAEAARFYPDREASRRLTALFDAIRTDLHLRTFLSPRILESLFVLADPATLPFFRELLTAGYTDHDVERCEVTRALVMVRRFTGHLEDNSKFAAPFTVTATETLDEAERIFEDSRATLTPVVVI